MKKILSYIKYVPACTLLLLIIILPIACQEDIVPAPVKYSKVERVFMHETWRYSFLVMDEKTKELVSITSKGDYYLKTHIFADVEDGKDCWAIVDQNVRTMEIHIHSAKEINGAGWNHGKFGRGETTPVE